VIRACASGSTSSRLITPQFRIIGELFPRTNPGRQGMKDQSCVATSPEEMLVIRQSTLHPPQLRCPKGASWSAAAFKGYSSCCFVHCLSELGISASHLLNSFAGLPMVPDEVGNDKYYQAGDFRGARVEVEQNLPHLWRSFQGWS